jgi:hypothetical protein
MSTWGGNEVITRRDFVRPLVLATAFTWIAELALLLYYGVYLSDEGSLLDKIIWTLGFCGIGMGLSMGGLIDLFLIGRVSEKAGIWLTTLFATLTLGVACNWLCMTLDRHFKYFGGAANPYLHFLPSFIGSVIGGWLLGWLLFSSRGRSILERFGI